MTTTLVSGDIKLPSGAQSFSGATVYLTLEGNAPMGMAPNIVTQSIMHNVDYSGSPIAFSISGNDDVGKCNLRVHISMDGSDEFEKGDYITKSTHTVLKNGAPDTTSVSVEKV